MNRTKLEHGRGVLLDRSGRPFHSGNLDFGQLETFLFSFLERDLEKQTFASTSQNHKLGNIEKPKFHE